MNIDQATAASSMDMSPVTAVAPRRRWGGLAIAIAIAAVAFIAMLTVITVVPSVMDRRSTVPTAKRSEVVPLQRWWADSHGDVEALQGTIYDAQHALAIRNPDTVASAAEAGSLTNYAGEFGSDMEQALRQLQAAQGLMNKMLTAA